MQRERAKRRRRARARGARGESERAELLARRPKPSRKNNGYAVPLRLASLSRGPCVITLRRSEEKRRRRRGESQRLFGLTGARRRKEMFPQLRQPFSAINGVTGCSTLPRTMILHTHAGCPSSFFYGRHQFLRFFFRVPFVPPGGRANSTRRRRVCSSCGQVFLAYLRSYADSPSESASSRPVTL